MRNEIMLTVLRPKMREDARHCYSSAEWFPYEGIRRRVRSQMRLRITGRPFATYTALRWRKARWLLISLPGGRGA